MSERLATRVAKLNADKRAGFVPFIMAGDPSLETSQSILNELPANGADIIELGMPFSDPMADGPTIEEAGIRALEAGTKIKHVLQMVTDFRQSDSETPIILMGYFNPVYHYGVTDFMKDASKAGVDGLIIVDLPAEEIKDTDAEAKANGIDIIRLIAPTTLGDRLPVVLEGASGFVYYIAVKGITGVGSANYAELKPQLEAIRKHTDLPIAVGFGIKSPEDVAEVSAMADLVVVGSAIVKVVGETGDASQVLGHCAKLAAGISK